MIKLSKRIDAIYSIQINSPNSLELFKFTYRQSTAFKLLTSRSIPRFARIITFSICFQTNKANDCLQAGLNNSMISKVSAGWSANKVEREQNEFMLIFLFLLTLHFSFIVRLATSLSTISLSTVLIVVSASINFLTILYWTFDCTVGHKNKNFVYD